MWTSTVFTACAGLVIAAGLPCPASAQGGPRQAAPDGREIAEKAKGIKLDKANATTADFHGKKITLTPADPSALKSGDELAPGRVIAVLENEAAGDETGLPPGKYDIFVAKVGDQWHAYAESNGQVVTEAKLSGEPRLDKSATVPRKPQFKEKGWCYWWQWALLWWSPWMCL